MAELSEVHKEADSAGRKALLFGGAALIVAGIFGWTLAHLSGNEGKTQAIVVARHDMPALTPFKAEDLNLVQWPRENLPSGYIADVNMLLTTSQVNLQELKQNEPILSSRISRTDGGLGVSVLVKAEMRAFVVELQEPVAKSSILHPGANVDVLATLNDPRGRGDVVSKVILQNVKVLAVGDRVDVEPQETVKPGERRTEDQGALGRRRVVTLEVALGDVEYLAYASSQGRVDLALRSNSDTELVPTEGVTTAKILGESKDEHQEVRGIPSPEAATRPAPHQRRRAKPSAPPPQPSGPSIYKVR